MRSLGWLTLLMAVGVAAAQQVEIVPEMPVDSTVLRQWLHSGDPRLMAWAADFARRRNDVETLAEMPGVLEHWAAPAIGGRGESQAAQRRAVMAVLDAVIAGNVSLPVEGIRQVAGDFPAQAAILASRLPLKEARGMLGDWTYGKTGGWYAPTLARVAAMMLAKEPDPWFVARVVAESEEELRVYVVASGGGFAEGGLGSGCGDSIGAGRMPDWPEVHGYDLVEGDDAVASSAVVNLDGDLVAFRRLEGDGPRASCHGVEPLDAATRHKLLASWLGIPDRGMTWQATERVTIEWSNQAAFEAALGAAVMAQRAKLRGMTRTLRDRMVLADGDPAEPRLVVRIQCAMTPCPLAGGTATDR